MSATHELTTEAKHTATGTVSQEDAVLVPSVGVGYVGWVRENADDPCARTVGIVVPNSNTDAYEVPYYVAVSWKV